VGPNGSGTKRHLRFPDPATRLCASLDEARQWVESETRALGGVPVEWVDKAIASGD